MSVLRAARGLADRRGEEQLSDAEAHGSRSGTNYDPGAVFILEFMLCITIRGSDSIEELWYESMNILSMHIDDFPQACNL